MPFPPPNSSETGLRHQKTFFLTGLDGSWRIFPSTNPICPLVRPVISGRTELPMHHNSVHPRSPRPPIASQNKCQCQQPIPSPPPRPFPSTSRPPQRPRQRTPPFGDWRAGGRWTPPLTAWSRGCGRWAGATSPGAGGCHAGVFFFIKKECICIPFSKETSFSISKQALGKKIISAKSYHSKIMRERRIIDI